MRFGQRTDRTSALVGVGAAAVLMAALMVCVGMLVVRYCPGGENCEEIGRRLYLVGLLVSFAISAAFGLIVRDIVDRRRNRLS